ncbi:hypothetical protein DDE18_17665 [Nocardioides gansuensis]|uniref:Uncharacterized protein n=1 Tax=Nocardioides gansuensis TaxID=2138300 RepID=A0A2T8F6I6_9ACTN|nr:hypothetical protein [Nocardioides gansuensis]PVG81320.1 hypothetical protein DDE18_17665 [Nocardioides gansuensis]
MGIVTTADDVVTAQGTPWDAPQEVLLDLQANGIRTVNGDPRFLVSARPDANGVVEEDVVGQALLAAAHRLQQVTYEGTELDEPLSLTGEYYTPNMVLGPVVTDDGFLIWADTKSEIPIPMLEKMTEIIVQALERAGASAHVAAGPKGVNPFDYPAWSPPVAG